MPQSGTHNEQQLAPCAHRQSNRFNTSQSRGDTDRMLCSESTTGATHHTLATSKNISNHHRKIIFSTLTPHFSSPRSSSRRFRRSVCANMFIISFRRVYSVSAHDRDVFDPTMCDRQSVAIEWVRRWELDGEKIKCENNRSTETSRFHYFLSASIFFRLGRHGRPHNQPRLSSFSSNAAARRLQPKCCFN